MTEGSKTIPSPSSSARDAKGYALRTGRKTMKKTGTQARKNGNE